MPRSRAPVAGAALACLIASLPAAGAATYTALETADFLLVSAAGERRTREIARDAALFASAMDRMFGVGSSRGMPARIHALSRADWQRYGEPRHGVAGYFTAHPFASDLLFDVETEPAQARELLFHEYTHHVLRKLGNGRHAAFFDEGLAEVFSTARIRDGAVRFDTRPEYVELLRRRTWMPLERLLAIERTDAEYVDRTRARPFYAQAWATMHYVVAQPGFPEQLMDYVRLTSAGASRREAAAILLGGASGGDSNERIARFILTQRSQQSITVRSGAHGTVDTLPIRHLPDAGHRLHLAELLIRLGGRSALAIALAREARAASGASELDRQRALIAEGYAHLQAGERPRALDLLDYLEPHASLPPASAVLLGRALFDLALHPSPGTSPEAAAVHTRRLERARTLFRHAREDRLCWAEAVNGYVLASLALHERSEELVALASDAFYAAPRSAELAVSLAMLHELNGRRAVARRYWADAAANLGEGPGRARIMERLARHGADTRPIQTSPN